MWESDYRATPGAEILTGKMREDVFTLVFPDETLGEKDVVELESSWRDARESWGCGEGTCYEEGADATFSIHVVWRGRKPRKPRKNGLVIGAVPFRQDRWFYRKPAAKFFNDLMKMGSRV